MHFNTFLYRTGGIVLGQLVKNWARSKGGQRWNDGLRKNWGALMTDVPTSPLRFFRRNRSRRSRTRSRRRVPATRWSPVISAAVDCTARSAFAATATSWGWEAATVRLSCSKFDCSRDTDGAEFCWSCWGGFFKDCFGWSRKGRGETEKEKERQRRKKFSIVITEFLILFCFLRKKIITALTFRIDHLQEKAVIFGVIKPFGCQETPLFLPQT